MFKQKKMKLSVALSCVAIIAPALAQERQGATLEEIIVTAEKREASLQDTPAAVAALQGDDLIAQGITDQSMLTRVVPGLLLGDQGGTGLFFIRGIGQTQGAANSQPAVAINLNGVYWSREMGITPLFDLERVEVLPGPQGTLWGRNAAGGAINFVTRKPTQEFGGELNLEVGDYELLHATGVVNMPVTDHFALRLAVDSNDHDAYMTNGAFDKDDLAYRLSALYDNDVLSIFLLGMHIENGGTGNNSVLFNEAGRPGPFNPTPNDPYNQTYSTAALYQDSVTDVVQAEVSYAFGNDLTLTYLPGYVRFDGDKNQQFMGTNPSRIEPSVDQKTHELRLSNGPDGRWRWVGGLYSHRADHGFNVTVGTHLPAPVGVNRFTNELKSSAAFGEATFSFTDDLRLTLGSRYSKDRFIGTFLGTTPPGSATNPLRGRADVETDNTDWKVGVEMDLRAEETLLYATIQTGYLMGGFVQDGGIFDPETLIAYTIGAKNRFLDGRLQLNGEAFYYDYEDYQLTYVQGTFFAAQNAPSEVTGIQLDAAMQVTDSDTFTLTGTWQDATILDERLFPRNGLPASIDGFDLPNAPDLTATAGWDHAWGLSGGARIVGRAQVYYSSGYWMVFTHDLNTKQESYTNSGASVTYEAANDRWSAGLWVRNIEDDAVYVGANKPAPNASTAPYLLAPRTLGASFRVTF
jgi:iron complex outermembrane receptor protein